jgi:hypothetical protein
MARMLSVRMFGGSRALGLGRCGRVGAVERGLDRGRRDRQPGRVAHHPR